MTTLRGIGVLLTRPEENAAALASAIESRGGRSVVCPMIGIAPPLDWAPCDTAIGRLAAYDAVLFTSAGGVRHFLSRCAEVGRTFPAATKQGVYAVGPSTAEALHAEGIAEIGVSPESTGRGLADFVLSQRQGVNRYLLPRGDHAREECARRLEEAGNIVDDPVVYRTCAADPEQLRRASAFVREGGVGVVTFASPSAVRNFAGAISPAQFSALSSRPRVVAVGPTTAAALREAGFPLDGIAPEPSVSGFITAIEQAIAS